MQADYSMVRHWHWAPALSQWWMTVFSLGSCSNPKGNRFGFRLNDLRKHGTLWYSGLWGEKEEIWKFYLFSSDLIQRPSYQNCRLPLFLNQVLQASSLCIHGPCSPSVVFLQNKVATVRTGSHSCFLMQECPFRNKATGALCSMVFWGLSPLYNFWVLFSRYALYVFRVRAEKMLAWSPSQFYIPKGCCILLGSLNVQIRISMLPPTQALNVCQMLGDYAKMSALCCA